MTELEHQLLRRVGDLEAKLDQAIAEIRCPRCHQDPSPAERWPGDPHARDLRPAHSCGREA